MLAKTIKVPKVRNLYFRFSCLYLFLAGNIIVYTPSQGANTEKHFSNYNIKVECRLWREKNFSIHLFPHRARLFYLSTEIGRSQSLRDEHQSVFFRADVLFTIWKVSSKNGKRLHISSSQENTLNYKMHDSKYENNKIVYKNKVKKINNYNLRAHFILIYNSSLVFTL